MSYNKPDPVDLRESIKRLTQDEREASDAAKYAAACARFLSHLADNDEYKIQLRLPKAASIRGECTAILVNGADNDKWIWSASGNTPGEAVQRLFTAAYELTKTKKAKG